MSRTPARCGIARAEAWLGTCRHVDSRTSTVVQVRGVSMTEEREGGEMRGRLRWAAHERPAGCGCTREFCVIKNKLRAKFKILLLSHSRLTKPVTPRPL